MVQILGTKYTWNMYLAGILLFLVGISNAWIPDMENEGLYEGDMILTPDQLRSLNDGSSTAFNILRDPESRWPGAVVYYDDSELSGSGEAMKGIREAIAAFHKYTCIRFKKRTFQREYIKFYSGFGCNGPVGYQKNRVNKLSLDKNCRHRSTVIHEICHSLGLFHEQSRFDRDNFVTIVKDNITPRLLYNFAKHNNTRTMTWGVGYDYLSLMHYTWNAFARKHSKPSIITKDSKYQYHIGQDEGLSVKDVEKLNLMYNCPGPYPTPPEYKIVPGCYNTGGDCVKGAEAGHCDSREWRSYMHAKCKRACKLCGDNSNVKPTDGPARTYPTTTADPDVTTTKDPNCKEIVSNCASLKGYCMKWVDFMLRKCPKTCNFC